MTWPVRVEVARESPSPNPMLKGRMHYHEYARMRQTWERELSAAVGGAPQLRRLRAAVQAAGKMQMGFTCRRKRLLDPNNVHLSVKPLIDAAKNIGLILDDSAELLEYMVRQERAGTMRPVTVIELRPAGGFDGTASD